MSNIKIGSLILDERHITHVDLNASLDQAPRVAVYMTGGKQILLQGKEAEALAWYLTRGTTDILARHEWFLEQERKEKIAQETPPEVEEFVKETNGIFGDLFKDFNKIFGG